MAAYASCVLVVIAMIYDNVENGASSTPTGGSSSSPESKYPTPSFPKVANYTYTDSTKIVSTRGVIEHVNIWASDSEDKATSSIWLAEAVTTALAGGAAGADAAAELAAADAAPAGAAAPAAGEATTDFVAEQEGMQTSTSTPEAAAADVDEPATGAGHRRLRAR